MRVDDRENDALREYRVELDFVPWAMGSVLIHAGQTAVLCNVSIADEQPRHCLGTGKGWITAEYAMLPQAGNTRSRRDGRPKVRGRTYEIQRLIGRSLRAGVNLHLLGPHTVTVDCDVLAADGGTRTASITGAWIALRIALSKFFSSGLPTGLLHNPWLAAVSAGLVNDQILLDLNYEEDSAAQLDLNLVGTGNGRFIEIQATSESKPVAPKIFQALIESAAAGVKTLCRFQEQTLIRAGY